LANTNNTVDDLIQNQRGKHHDGDQNDVVIQQKGSRWFYMLPAFLGLLGGFIMYFTLSKEDN
jgi:hypothetical protein